MILSIDPGRRPGYVLLDPNTLVERRHLPGFPRLPLVIGVWLKLPAALPRGRESHLTHVVCESQYGILPRERRRSVFVLANEAGWQLCTAVARYGGIPVLVYPQALTRTDAPGWRDGLRCAGCQKAIVQRRVEKSLTPTEASLFACSSPGRMGDLFDATAIGWGAWITDLPEWSTPT